MSRRAIVPFICVMMLLLPSMGCLDVQLWKRFVEGEEKKQIGYEDVEVHSYFWKYDFTPTDIFNALLEGDPTGLTDKEDEKSFRVKEGTTRMVVSYNLTMLNPSESGWEAIQALVKNTIGDDNQVNTTMHALKNLDRHLEIWVTGPDSKVAAHRRHNESLSDTEQIFIDEPEDGTWTIRIESRGIGFEDDGTGVRMHDEYHVWTLVRQPKFS